eukprot:3192430-Alexandrium_andersonii.AAC.1
MSAGCWAMGSRATRPLAPMPTDRPTHGGAASARPRLSVPRLPHRRLPTLAPVSYTHLRAHETSAHL